jgi:hypothetical protein
MTVFDQAQHIENPPETWRVERIPETRRWALVTDDGDAALAGDRIDTFETMREAQEARESGFMAELWRKESRWYAGESINGWRDYSEVRK